MQKINPCLWFNDQAERAAIFYSSLFTNTKINKIAYRSESDADASEQ